jgi:hypothetical protein
LNMKDKVLIGDLSTSNALGDRAYLIVQFSVIFVH